MKNFQKTKALERLYAALSQSEFDQQYGVQNNFQLLDYNVKLMVNDIPHILDVLAVAINEERSK